MPFRPSSEGIKARRAVFAIALVQILWSICFVLRSSLIALDGRRYFSLFDDAMISMRYAWNLAHGAGLTWNPGERVEGYTNFLTTLMMSGYSALLDKSHAVLAVQLTGALVVCSCLLVCWKLGGLAFEALEGDQRRPARIALLALTAAYYPLSYWSLMGMETGLLALLILSSVYFAESYRRETRRRALLALSVLQGLAYLARPDAVIFFAPTLYYALFDGVGRFTVRRRLVELTLAIAPYLLIVAGHEAFRIRYYHELLPNTYYLKLTGMPLPDRLRNGLGYVKLYLLTHGILLGVALASARIRGTARGRLYLGLVLLPLLYQVWAGGDPWPYWRLMTPTFPVLAAAYLVGGMDVIRQVEGSSLISAGLGRRLAGYLVAFGILLPNIPFFGELLLIKRPYETDQYGEYLDTALALNEVTSKEATIGVYCAGVIPYYADRRAIDFLGKNDKYISRLPPDLSGAVAWSGMTSVPGHNKYDLAYSIKRLQPTYIQSPVWKGQSVAAWAMNNYAVVSYRGVPLWLKKGSADVDWRRLAR